MLLTGALPDNNAGAVTVGAVIVGVALAFAADAASPGLFIRSSKRAVALAASAEVCAILIRA